MFMYSLMTTSKKTCVSRYKASKKFDKAEMFRCHHFYIIVSFVNLVTFLSHLSDNNIALGWVCVCVCCLGC